MGTEGTTGGGGEGTTTTATATAGGGGGEATTTTQTPDWTAGFNDEMKGYVQTKGFKDPASVLDSYRNFEKLMGAPKERILKLPEKSDDPMWNDIHNRLGRPETPDKYSFKLAKEMGGEDAEKWTKELFHNLGLSDKQASGFLEKWSGKLAEGAKAAQDANQAKLAEQEKAVKKEWGAAYEQNVGVARRAANALGVTDEHLDALEHTLGYDGVMKLFHNIGSKSGEAAFHAGDKGPGFNGVLTPQQAQHRITELKSDPGFTNKYLAGDLESRQMMERLHKQAYPDG